MKYVFLIVLAVLVVGFSPEQQLEIVTVCRKFNALNTAVRDGTIERKKAEQQFKELISRIDNLYQNDRAGNRLTFPVDDDVKSSIGGKNGDGYKPKGYNYFDGNKHKGHPAHDIFFPDRNQDARDDYTDLRVYVESIQDGIVVARETEWKWDSNLRGGNYLWIYNPKTKSLFYYAHNQSDILVGVGEYVVSGQHLAFIGRSGLNAAKKRSPTHLHFMQLVLDTNYLPKPVNCYDLLLKCLRSSLPTQ
jgi:peptidoglycan LD-endopeptidase LytH